MYEHNPVMTGKNSNRRNFFNRHRNALICLCLILATLAVYWQARTHEFSGFDDDEYITENHHVRDGLSVKGIAWAFTSAHASNWHPVTWLSHMLDCQLFGMTSGWHHLTNVLFHIANTILLFLVFGRMTGKIWRSALVAALFALHPLHVESVAWLAERKDVLSTLFWMLTMWAYVRYVERTAHGRYALVLLFFILGLMAKPMLVTLPFVLLLLDYWPLGRFQPRENGDSSKVSPDLWPVWEKIPLFALSAMSSVVTLFVQQSGGAIRSFDQYPLGLRTANALVSYVRYIGKMLWPRNLAIFYPFPDRIPWWHVAGACFLLILISVLAIWTARRRPYFLVGWLWYVGTLVPVIGLVQVGKQAMADRYTYIPLIGIFVIIAWAVPELVAHRRYSKMGLSTAAAAALSVLTATTWLQVSRWANGVTLFEHALDSTTDNWLAHNHLGLALVAQGKFDNAINHYFEALRIDPDYANPHTNLGVALAAQGKYEDAISHYSKVLSIEPDSADVHNNLGALLAAQGRFDDAVSHYSEALKIDPDHASAHYNLGLAFAARGMADDAIRHYSETVRIDPDNASAHMNLGLALAAQGKYEDAIRHYSETLSIDPASIDAHNNLAVALTAQGKFDEAISHYFEVLKIKPDSASARVNMGIISAKRGKLDEAIGHYSEALKIKPDPARLHDYPNIVLAAHYNMGIALVKQGKLEDAINHYSEALKVNPNFANGHINIGNILGKLGRTEEALGHFREALRIEPDNAALRLHLKKYYEASEKLDGGTGQHQEGASVEHWDQSQGPAHENVILITIDTLRADHLGCYGYPRQTSPAIDALARKSVVFDNCISQATSTTPSHASIFTSLYPPTHGVIRNVASLSPNVPSLVGVFKDNGYYTGAIVSSIAVASRSGLQQGFEEYDETLGASELNRKNYYERRADLATETAMRWIRKNIEKKIFLWIHYIDPHGAYYPPEEYRKMFLNDQWYSKGQELPIAATNYVPNSIPRYQALFGIQDASYYVSQYDAEIRFTDDQIGRLLRFLEGSDRMSKTIMVITSDHGESLTERDYRFFHGVRTYDEQAVIPLMIHFPDTGIHKRIREQVMAIDIMPTILHKLGIENPHTIQGTSLMPLILSGDKQSVARPAVVFSDYGIELFDSKVGAQRTIRTQEWKFTRNSWDGSEELYNLDKDPLEKTNLAQQEPAVSDRMRKLLDKWEHTVDKTEVFAPELPQEVIEQMEALGYLVK